MYVICIKDASYISNIDLFKTNKEINKIQVYITQKQNSTLDFSHKNVIDIKI